MSENKKFRLACGVAAFTFHAGRQAALRANKAAHIYKLYPGEGYGFNKTRTNIDLFESLVRF